ncbi:MAG: hypothetical protein MUE41_05325, partial [Gemmatimonadaceae bacterium]|nr:hypothetical protein [Gemmatimonadaceae bacterium]
MIGRRVLRHLVFACCALHHAGAQAAESAASSASPLAQLLERASRNNRRVPDDLAGYRGRAESELAVMARRAEGAEAVAGIEQVASQVTWDRAGAFDQRVVGHRMLAAGPQVAIVSFFPTSYLIPTLYGNRLLLFFSATPVDSARARRRAARTTTARARADTTPRGPGVERSRTDSQLVAAHPLAESRDRYSTFSGGDTVVTLQPGSG